jgi:hypothetical protein
LVIAGTRTIQSQYAGGILLPPVQKLVATSIFAPCGAKMQTSPVSEDGVIPVRVSGFLVMAGTRIIKSTLPGAGWRRGLDRAEPLFLPFGQKCKRVPSAAL